MSKLDISGIAYLCFQRDIDDFKGFIITLDRNQYCVEGHLHKFSEHAHHQNDEDPHTCCYDDSAKMMDLTVIQLNDLREDIIPHVMKSGGDNCSLNSKCVKFITDDLLVGQKADSIISKYFSTELVGKDCFVCVGQIAIKYPAQPD